MRKIGMRQDDVDWENYLRLIEYCDKYFNKDDDEY